ncbi:MAG: MMPL family transporter [Myxococcales bacterium]|nr:MMPL family transporter [Myxococcales bacterium]MDH3843004.1 MMPL family transporter [Myxococcales bacterium]
MKRALLVLGVAVGLTTLGVAAARSLELNTSVEALLPSDSVSVVSIQKTRDKLGIEEPLTILVASDNAERNKALTAQLAAELSKWPETQWVMTGYGLDRLAERALYYVDAETLDEWSELAEEALDWEVCKASPVCVTIADPPELPDSGDVRAAVDASPAGQVLRELTGTSAKKARANDEGAGGPTALCNDDGSVCAVQAMLDGSPGDLRFARMINERAEAIIEPLEVGQPEETRIRVIGRYRVAPLEHSIILDDLRLVAILAAVGSLLLVLVFFRDPTAVVQLAVPMLSGLAVAVGLIALIEPSLNIISASALAILAGMAIDFGIHLLMHYQAARADGLSPPTAAKASVQEFWVSLLVAGVTTACGFAALSMTDFQGFSQMGWMASLGIMVTLLWTLAIFPSVVRVLPGTDKPRRQRPARPSGNRKLAIAGLVLGLLAIPLAANVDFERNLGDLQPKVVEHGINADVMRARRHINALYLGETRQDVDHALGSEAMTEGGLRIMGVEPIVVSSQVIFPADADDKTATLDKIRDTLRRAHEKAIERGDQKTIEEIDEIESWLEIDGAPQPDQLPPWLAATLVEKDGSVGKSGIIYVPLRGSDADAMERLATWLEELRAQNPDVTFASAAGLLGEVTPALVRDAPWILGLVFLGLIVATGVASRSLVVTRDVFLATAMSAIFFGAALDVLGIELHLYNLLAVPVVIGLSVDGAVHVRWAQMYDDQRREYATYKAVAASTLTSMVAFGALMTASHPGIRSLGTVGVLGLGISLLVNLGWLRTWVGSNPTDWAAS